MSWWSQLSSTSEQPERDAALWSAAQQSRFDPPEWHSVQLRGTGPLAAYRAIVPITNALTIDGVRATSSARTLQRIADTQGYTLITPTVADAAWLQARYTPAPTTGRWYAPRWKNGVNIGGDGTMGQTRRTLDASRLVDDKLRTLGWSGAGALLGNEGKDWALAPGLSASRALNTGLYTAPGGLARIQAPATTHDFLHGDYSQVMRVMGPWVVVYGPSPLERRTWSTRELLTDPQLGALLTGPFGPLSTWRQPGEPELPQSGVPFARAGTAPPEPGVVS